MKIFLVGLLLYGTKAVDAEIWAYEKVSGKSAGVFENEFIIFDSGRASQFAAHLRMAEPPDACESNSLPPPKLSEPTSWVLLATEGGCNLHTKIFNAQEAGYQSIIVMLDAEQAKAMNVNRKNAIPLKINVSFIGYIDGIKLKRYVYSQSSEIRHLIDINYKKKVPPNSKPKQENQQKKEQPKPSYSTYNNYNSHKTTNKDYNVGYKVLTGVFLFLVSITVIAVKHKNYLEEQQAQKEKLRRKQEQERQRERDHRRQQERNAKEQERQRERNQRSQQERDEEEQERQRKSDQRKQYEHLFAYIGKLSAAKTLLGFQPSDRPTRAEINTNFRHKSRSVHPDKFADLPDSERKQKEEECKKLTEAKTFLLDNIV